MGLKASPSGVSRKSLEEGMMPFGEDNQGKEEPLVRMSRFRLLHYESNRGIGVEMHNAPEIEILSEIARST